MRPAVEPTLTIRPSPLARSAGSSAWATWRRPRTLTSYIRRQSSGSASATGAKPNAPPASLTSTWGLSPTASASAATDSGEVTSHVAAVPSISSARAAIRSVRRAAHTTAYPSAASARAVAAPMPLLAPVTTAVRRGALLTVPILQRTVSLDPTGVADCRAHGTTCRRSRALPRRPPRRPGRRPPRRDRLGPRVLPARRRLRGGPAAPRRGGAADARDVRVGPDAGAQRLLRAPRLRGHRPADAGLGRVRRRPPVRLRPEPGRRGLRRRLRARGRPPAHSPWRRPAGHSLRRSLATGNPGPQPGVAPGWSRGAGPSRR